MHFTKILSEFDSFWHSEGVKINKVLHGAFICILKCFYKEKSGASYKEVHNRKPELCNHQRVFATVAYFLYRHPSGLKVLHSFVRRPEKKSPSYEIHAACY